MTGGFAFDPQTFRRSRLIGGSWQDILDQGLVPGYAGNSTSDADTSDGKEDSSDGSEDGSGSDGSEDYSDGSEDGSNSSE